MDPSYPDVSSLWDLSHSNNFPQLPDDDFMAMLQKQFPLPAPNNLQNNTGFPHTGVNPQNISKLSLPSLSPPSDDSSPSPPHNADFSFDPNVEDSPTAGDGDSRSGSAGPRDPNLKRKASMDVISNGPSQKSQHTLSNDKKGATSSTAGTKRKSIGGTVHKDETRLMKRKEQNRAAQRAFRERKEKHVKDLEDKVAELEAKNDATQHENENLRELLSRLQSENVMLKQSNFTFTMSPPKSQSDPPAPPRHFSPEASIYTTPSPAAPSMVSPESSRVAPKATNLLDWTSLTSFDPNMLSLLEESPPPQPTATSSAMDLDFFGNLEEGHDSSSSSPFTMIASNPVFMSYASSFDTMQFPENSSPPVNKPGIRSNPQSFNFDMNSLGSWPTSTPPAQDTSLDDLFAGYIPNQGLDFSAFGAPSMSPVTHQTNVNNPTFGNVGGKNFSYLPRSSDALRLSSVPSPSSQSTTSSDPSLSTPKDGHMASIPATPESDQSPHISKSATDAGYHVKTECPKTKSELLKRINEAGSSPFARAGLAKGLDQHGSIVSCIGTNLPKTAKSDNNVEVLSAWRSITSNPAFKDANIDINDLCAQFTDKARCDGTKVVLEPEGMHDIIESLSNHQ